MEARHRIYLFAEPDGETTAKDYWYSEDTEDAGDETSGRVTLLTHDGHLCLGPKEAVNELLKVELDKIHWD